MTTPQYWPIFLAYRSLVEDARKRGVAVPAVYGSPTYLSQYLPLHEIVDAESLRIRSGRGEPARVLDWGAGVGHCAFVRSSRGDDVIAHCLTEDEPAIYLPLLRRVCESASIELKLTSDPVSLPMDNGSLDIVISCGVLEHVHEGGGNLDESMAEIARVLRPGGAFVCGHLPNNRSWIEWVNRRLNRSHHDRTFSAVQAHRLGQANHLDLVQAERYGVIPRIQAALLASRLHLDRPIAGRALGQLDRGACAIAGGIAQNHLVVLRKGGVAPSVAGDGKWNDL